MMKPRSRSDSRKALALGLLACLLARPAHAASPAEYRGRSIQSVIEALRAEGWPFVYSTRLLPKSLRVLSEPQGTEPLEQVREMLAPYGLTLRASGGYQLVVREQATDAPAPGSVVVSVRAGGFGEHPAKTRVSLDSRPARQSAPGEPAEFSAVAPGRHRVEIEAPGHAPKQRTIEVTPGRTSTLVVDLDAPRPLEELTVTTSRYDVARAIQPSTASLSRENVESLSTLGDDPVRTLRRLPGIAAGDFSARAHVRGGYQDETSIVFDGQELIDPFHLGDYQALFSTIDQRAISDIQVYSGGFPAAYGGSLSGLMLIDPMVPPPSAHQEISLSLLSSSLLSSGRFRDNRGEWLASARRGNLDLLLDRNLSRPSYRDAFTHLGLKLSDGQKLSFDTLTADDDIAVIAERNEPEQQTGRSDTENRQLWVKLDSDWTDRLTSTTILSASRYTNQRRGFTDNPVDVSGSVSDTRALSSFGLKQDWRWRASDRQLLSWGARLERQVASYDYTSNIDVFGLLTTLDAVEPSLRRDFALEPHSSDVGLYVSDRLRITDRLIGEIGIRWDRQTRVPGGSGRQLDPRASLLYRLDGDTDLRLSWGRFSQPQSLLELQLQDGIQTFFPAEQAVHSILGLEHRFDDRTTFRAEAFRKTMTDLRPRFENLLNPFPLIPELVPGRVRIAPERATAEGLELSIARDGPLSWWASYTLSRVEDVIAGEPVPRTWDQRNALSMGTAWHVSDWLLAATATLHSGWPTTALLLENVSQAAGSSATRLVAGPRNRQRLGGFRQIDVKAAKRLDVGRGSMYLTIEVSNLFNHDNPCCRLYEPSLGNSGEPVLELDRQHWLPRVASIGARWEF
jgi:hypothetical protein